MVTQPYLSGSVPSWIALNFVYNFVEIGLPTPSLQYWYSFPVVRSTILHIGEMTAAVPHAPTSSKSSYSSTGIGRCSTFKPISSARTRNDMLVIEGKMDADDGVT